jgi:amino acid permease
MLVIFNIFATIAYFCYVGQTNSILALNFATTPFTTFIIVCVCINALCSYPVQILCAFDILEQNKFFKTGTNCQKKAKSMVARSLIIMLITGIALLIPNFTDFLNIMGSLGAALIAFILPPWLYNIEFKATISQTRKWFNYLVMVIGVVGGALSIYTSIKGIIDAKSDKN